MLLPISLIALLVTLSFSIICERDLIVLCFLNWNKSKSFPQQMLHCREWDSVRTACHVDSSHWHWDFIWLIWSTWPEHITSLRAAGNAFGREGGKKKYPWTQEKVIIPLRSIRIQAAQCFYIWQTEINKADLIGNNLRMTLHSSHHIGKHIVQPPSVPSLALMIFFLFFCVNWALGLNFKR